MAMIQGISTAVSKTRFTQKEVLEHVAQLCEKGSKTFAFYRKFLSDPGIESRHFALNKLLQSHEENADEAITRFQQQATELGYKAAKSLLRKMHLSPSEIDALIVTTCTGYLCPGLTSYLAESLKLRQDVLTHDLVGTGCGAALPALRVADELVSQHPNKRALVVCVEICSAAMAWGEEIDLILSNCLFADGAAACLVSQSKKTKGIEIKKFESLLWPQYRNDLRFGTRDGRLKNVIKKSVPELTAKAVSQLSKKLQNRKAFDFTAVHPGGRKILDRIEETLQLPEAALKHSRHILKRYGNMSSPTILFVLKEFLEKEKDKKGKTLLALAFGAGFTAFGMQMEFV